MNYSDRAIEVITSKKRVLTKLDPYTDELVTTKVNVWNPTVANLSLMALGSSAPEILLNVIETLGTLGSKPGELGPSTIVGSASFNFLIISGISIFAVNETNDERTDEEVEADGCPRGVKKVQDTGVFAITTTWSIIAYIWLFVVLSDDTVEQWEAFLTLGFFFIFIIMAYIADCCRRQTIKKREDAKYGHGVNSHGKSGDPSQDKMNSMKFVPNMDVKDFYNILLPMESGEKCQPSKEQMTSEMKEFLLYEFGTTKVSEVNKDHLKAKLEGPAFIERIAYRKAVGIHGRKEAVSKGATIRRENKSADLIEDHQKNPNFGFSCLHYSVSEAAGALRIKIINKNKEAGEICVRTVDGDAVAEDDYYPIDEPISFKKGVGEAEVSVRIIDDDGWEPDEDFYVEIYDPNTGSRLIGEDTRTRVTILDDDKPGMLVFEEKQAIRHPANDKECVVVVNRIQGTDGPIKCRFKTVPLGIGEQSAKPDVDFIPIEGELEFAHQESRKTINITILEKEGEERDEIFGLKLYDADPAAVKISKKDTAIIEIVTDAAKKK